MTGGGSSSAAAGPANEGREPTGVSDIDDVGIAFAAASVFAGMETNDDFLTSRFFRIAAKEEDPASVLLSIEAAADCVLDSLLWF